MSYKNKQKNDLYILTIVIEFQLPLYGYRNIGIIIV